ncbi:MAG: hypothetical protein IKT46_00155 [Clostridia bacterium]|nr:hypothetical protein [Clostridia bacterium]
MKKIKIISMILTLAILVTSCNLGMMFTSSAATTINVGSAADLAGLATSVNSATSPVTIKITADIDASGITYTPIDATNKVIYFNGNYHTISNLNMSGGGLFTNVAKGSYFYYTVMYNCTITDLNAGNKVGFGFLAGVMTSGRVVDCIVDGTISVYGDNPSYIGGLVGSFGGDMHNSFAMVDINTNGSYVGGLIGSYTESSTATTNLVTKCYSTGSIDNDGRNYIGGLIGYSFTPSITESYTSMCILNPYADTVKSIGVIKGLEESHHVYYDENVSLQRQGDMDPHRCTPAEIKSKLKGTGWVNYEGYYPQISFDDGNRENIKRMSAISTAIVDVSREDGLTTGREFTVVSSADKYSYATITKNVGTASNRIDWRISGGVDEYYFDPTDLSNFPTNEGATIDGLSGNTYDANTGKYLFTNTGDIKFTAYSGSFERDIYVHVTTADKNPYIVGGNGTAQSPFIINDYNEFDMIRVYCLDDETGKYNYKLEFTPVKYQDNFSTTALFDLATVSHLPIIGMKGVLDGNKTLIANLSITNANEGNIGLFATVSNKCTISNLHISNAVIKSNKTTADGTPVYAENAGILAGSMRDCNVINVIATGTVENSKNSGMIAGEANTDTLIDTCITYGIVSGTEAAAGIVAVTDDTTKAISTYSTAVVVDAETVSGFFAVGGGDVEDSLFTGNIGTVKNGTRYGLVDSGTVTNSYYDWQAAGILYSEDSYAVTTADLTGNSDKIELSDKWEVYPVTSQLGGSAVHYPQLKYFAGDNYNGVYSTYKSRTSFVASVSFNYVNELGPASSVSFETVEMKMAYDKYSVTSNMVIGKPVAYPADSASTGYAFVRGDLIGATDIGMYKNGMFELKTGGKQLYTIKPFNALFNADTRYVMFNVKSINVHYKFVYEDADLKTEYNADMHNKGLTKVTNSLANEYNLFLNSQMTDEFESLRFLYVGETMNFKMTLPVKYTYTITAFKDAACTQPVSVTTSDSGANVSIADLDDVYIIFNISEPTLPWGIYRIFSN